MIGRIELQTQAWHEPITNAATLPILKAAAIRFPNCDTKQESESNRKYAFYGLSGCRLYLLKILRCPKKQQNCRQHN